MHLKVILALLVVVGAASFPQTALEQTVTDQLGQVQEDRLASVIERLSWCESRHNEYALNKDDGGSPSYGRFQFKEATWHYYLDRYGLFPEVERAERMNLIWDGYSQEIVARMVLEEGAWQNWYNCLKPVYSP